MPPPYPRNPPRRGKRGAPETPGRLDWRLIRISYRTLRILGVVFGLLAVGAAGSIYYSRSRGTESLFGRVFSIARRKVDQRIQVLSSPEAKDEILEQRSAVLSFFSGRVEIQRATDLTWKGAAESQRLASGDRVRTFANARAEVTFDEGNVLRIKPDSLIVIGDLTENVRTKVKKSSVRLLVSSIEADIKKSVVRGSQFKIEMPTAVAEVEKARLAVEIGKDSQSQLRVFTGRVDLDTGQQRVQVTDRKQVMISALKQVTSPENILPPPRLSAPQPLESFPTAADKVALVAAWTALPGARLYRLEIASDRFFDRMVFDREDLAGTSSQSAALGPGVYFIRVAGIDLQGRPGDFSDPVPVRVVLDRVPPILEVQKCVVQRSARGREVLINGRTEPNAAVTVAGRAVVVDPSGYFSAVLRDLPAGQGELEVTARDRAGNVQSVRQAIQS